MSCSGCLKRAKQFVAGVAGVTKAIVGVDLADAKVIEDRRIICRKCEFAKTCPTNKDKKCMCAKCGCMLTLKTKLAKETCPSGKW